jgi:hypothetical protein
MATESRLVLSHVVGERPQKMADQIVTNTVKRLKSIPLFATEGLKLYTIALRKQYGKLKQFSPVLQPDYLPNLDLCLGWR